MAMTQEKYIAHLEETIKSLKDQISNLTEMVILLNKKQFGHSSEKTPKTEVLDEQLYIDSFNEIEVLANPDVPEPPLVEMIAPRRKLSKAQREQLITTLPVTEVECILEGEEKLCPWCKTEMQPIGKEQVRQELQFIPAQLKITNYVRYTYACPNCKKDGEAVIIKAPTPKPVLKHSLASPSSVGNIIYQKYVNAVPLYRQERDWPNYGIKLSRGLFVVVKIG